MSDSDRIRGDLVIVCPQCGVDWTLTEAERRKFYEKGLHQPKRCPDCREEKQDQQHA